MSEKLGVGGGVVVRTDRGNDQLSRSKKNSVRVPLARPSVTDQWELEDDQKEGKI